MEQTEVKKANYNAIRSNKISNLKRKALEMAKQVSTFISENSLPDENEDHMLRLKKNLEACSNYSLYTMDFDNNDITYYASHTCDNKNCPICNYNRQKRIRRKYYKWFDDNSELVSLYNTKSKKYKVVTVDQFESKYKNDVSWLDLNREKYDVMHLTLTVPHYKESGFNGNKYYFDEIAKLYWNMRREKFWNQDVYGGEYGIECTNTDNGLNIHIHSLIFVRKFTQNRNVLHKNILLYWNKNTVNKCNLRTLFTDDVRSKIKKGNKLIDDDFINQLEPMGGTMITLENIFSWNSNKTEKVIATEFGSDEMLSAVMEAISYHFEPTCFDKDNGTFDLELLSELMPVIYGKALYKKFGCLHGEKSLNIKFNSKLEEMTSDLKESAELDDKSNTYEVDTDTGEIKEVRRYFICNPAYIYHFGDREDMHISLSKKAKELLKYINSTSAHQAIDFMIQLVVSGMKLKNT